MNGELRANARWAFEDGRLLHRASSLRGTRRGDEAPANSSSLPDLEDIFRSSEQRRDLRCHALVRRHVLRLGNSRPLGCTAQSHTLFTNENNVHAALNACCG